MSTATASQDSTSTQPPLSAQVRERIREAIIRGTYPQGARLPETRLATELQVSRNPLRAAIPQLETEGFVTTNPRRGAIVFRWTEDAVSQLFDARLAVEVAASGYAARRARNGADMSPLVEAIRQSHHALEHQDAYDIATTSTQIHTRIVEMAGNEILSSLMRTIGGRMNWLFYLTSGRDALLARNEHDRLCQAIEDGNEDLARSLAYAHIEVGRTPSLAVIAARRAALRQR